MVLVDKQIRSLCAEDVNNKLINPFDENALQSESYDLSIGDEISWLKKGMRYIDLAEQDKIDDLYTTIKIPKEGFDLLPKEYVLVQLKETVTLPENLTAHIRPRTKFTRLGLLVSDQHCNSTYSGVLRLGLFNATDNVIRIKSNLKVAQIVFEELKDTPSENKLYKNKANASYQNEAAFVGAKFSDEFNKSIDKAVNWLIGEEE